ncbi:MAG TPA: hypothetical protein VGJ25_11295 [Gaiellaceae bacterium]|jgi:hypothetical protein
MALSLALWVADAAEEGKKTIISMLVVGLIFVAVIALGELTHWAGTRRKARKRALR